MTRAIVPRFPVLQPAESGRPRKGKEASHLVISKLEKSGSVIPTPDPRREYSSQKLTLNFQSPRSTGRLLLRGPSSLVEISVTSRVRRTIGSCDSRHQRLIKDIRLRTPRSERRGKIQF